MQLKELSEKVRNGNLIIDFVSLEISQRSSTGINLTGHGVLRIDPDGALTCDIVCTKAEGITLERFSAAYPLDHRDKQQVLMLRGVDLSGREWRAENFALRLSMLRTAAPFKCSVLLSEVVHEAQQQIPSQLENYLWFQFSETSNIPKNKTNSIDDSLVGQSRSWNQTDITVGESTISIIDNGDHTTAYVNGKFDVEEMYSALKFYIGFTSGSMPNAFLMTCRNSSNVRHHIRSINKRINLSTMPYPIEEHLALSAEEWNHKYHYELLRNIIHVQNKNPLFYESTVSQWKRTWQGFTAQQSLAALALTVSIEGLLIDLFIPQLKKDIESADFEKTKREIIEKLTTLKIDEKHVETLVDGVNRWGNIHASAALKILADKGLITKQEVQAWKDLRNGSTHPKFSDATPERESKELKRLTHCLNLYYKLNLNIYAYKGGHVIYDRDNTMSVIFPSIRIFDPLDDHSASLSVSPAQD
ncbi:hypothetical protein [Pseudomonas sp. W5-36]|uniref:hypothetical protein n=1 Tax=Pseudomonas sp. W5-36 TaxID=3097455 RepID=UPI00397E64A6